LVCGCMKLEAQPQEKFIYFHMLPDPLFLFS
jgi:hypothetical protein